MKTRLMAETLDRDGLSLEVKAEEPATRAALAEVGAAWARAHAGRAPRVRVRLYGVGMDEDGPPVVVTRIDGGGEPVSHFTPVATLLLHYLDGGGPAEAHDGMLREA